MRTTILHSSEDFIKVLHRHCNELSVLDDFYMQTYLLYHNGIACEKWMFFENTQIGDDIFDAVYDTLKELGLRRTESLMSPYDVIEMQVLYRKVSKKGVVDDFLTDDDLYDKPFGLAVRWKYFEVKR